MLTRNNDASVETFGAEPRNTPRTTVFIGQASQITYVRSTSEPDADLLAEGYSAFADADRAIAESNLAAATELLPPE
ncbi:MAG: hypothetical protein ACJ760_14105 [Thermoleophilaceae bacterium]